MPQSVVPKFVPHPGKLHVHYRWNGSDEEIDTATLPETRYFIYYDKDGKQSSTKEHASYRVPILEEEVTTLDKAGNSVSPEHASFFSIVQYGPGHRFLRETHATGGS